MLKDKKILLAVCGSIAFYKAYEILSGLKKLGAKVQIMLSDGALKFCTPLGFEALSDYPVLYSGNEKWQEGLNHINYAKVDLILIAPASVNTINRLASGVCDTIFMQTLIASKAPLLIAPAANDKMLSHFSTKRNFDFLEKNGAVIIEPVYKILACKDEGKGALAEVNTIINECIKALSTPFFKGKKVLITGGGTSENLDPVRTITNNSSGKMATSLAWAFYYANADVTLAASFKLSHNDFRILEYKTTAELLKICKDEAPNVDLIVMCAAVSDYKPEEPYLQKIKKEQIGELWQPKLIKNTNILNEIKNFSCKKIGFKLETDDQDAILNATKSLKNHNLDAVCLNVIGKDNDFGKDKNEVSFISRNGISKLKLDTKDNIAFEIVRLASKL